MKKYLLLIVLSVFAFYSCEDDLLTPFTPGALTEDVVIQTTADLSNLLNSSYSLLVPTTEIEFNSIFTDEASIGFGNGGQGLTDGEYGFFLNSNSDAPNGIWASLYFTLSRVNRVIKFSDNITPVNAADEAVLNRILGEAHALRAHCHIQLLAYFSTNPKDLNALAAVLSNDVYPTSFQGVRTTNAVFYDQIESDLNKADNFFVQANSTFNPIFASRNFVTTLRARVAALKGDYPQALIHADNVINNSGLSLATFANYNSVFHTDSNADNVEVIFKLKRLVGQTRTGAIWASVNSSVGGSPFYEVGRSLFNLINRPGLPTANNGIVTAISGTTLTVQNNTLAVNDMVVFNASRPLNATTSNGTTTSPTNSLLSGKVYFVRTVNGNNITLTDTANGTTNINFTGANGTGLSLAFKFSEADIRYAALVHPSSIIDINYQTTVDVRNSDKITFRKYPGTTANGLLVNDIKIARLTELYFIKAEAQVAAGDLSGAAQTIKTVLDARFNKPQPLPVFNNATEAWKEILKQRRIDLACEGFRFLDLKRLGQLAGEQIQRDPRDCEVNGACTLPVTDFRFALPIPTIESNANSGILAQQNPGY